MLIRCSMDEKSNRADLGFHTQALELTCDLSSSGNPDHNGKAERKMGQGAGGLRP